MKIIETPFLTDFLLNCVRKAPGMYLAKATMTNLSILITGYHFAKPDDFYFDSQTGFLEWYYSKYQLKEFKFSYWIDYFLYKAENDEYKALMFYFENLEEYNKQKKVLSQV